MSNLRKRSHNRIKCFIAIVIFIIAFIAMPKIINAVDILNDNSYTISGEYLVIEKRA